jgi:hypothetical protein
MALIRRESLLASPHAVRGRHPNLVGARFQRGALETTILKPEQREPRRVRIGLEPSPGDAAPLQSAMATTRT